MHPTCTPEYLEQQGFSPTLPERFWAKVNKNGPFPKHMPHLGQCWDWTGSTQQNFKLKYGQLGRGARGTGTILAHIASWIINNGPIEPGVFICHKCDYGLCTRPSHLFIGDYKSNARDMCLKFRQSHTLSPDDVIKIRSLYEPRIRSQRMLADEFGVSQAAIWYILHHRNWKHL
jgi:hypothetical protein